MTAPLITDDRVLELAQEYLAAGVGVPILTRGKVLAFAHALIAEHDGQRVHVPEPLEVMARAVHIEQGDSAP